jgi:hypothetical protein
MKLHKLEHAALIGTMENSSKSYGLTTIVSTSHTFACNSLDKPESQESFISSMVTIELLEM